MAHQRLRLLQQHLARDAPAPMVQPEAAAASWFEPPSATVPIADAYDYIVVGAGSAGAALAARLSEDPKVTVLLVEAGVEHNRGEVNTPGAYTNLHNTEIDWQFRTTPQTHMNKRVSVWPRGKVLGGCSSINAMMVVRGHSDDYNRWAKAGCEGWSYKDVLPLFKKMEDCRIPKADLEYRGRGGPIAVTPAANGMHNPHADWFVDAAVASGIPRTSDFNGALMNGTALSQTNVLNGERVSTAHAYLDPIRATRKNLTIATKVHVMRVLIQGDTATGIEYKRGSHVIKDLRGKPSYVAHARREVVLCAGAVNTPWLLQVSGIGPREWLEPLGIPVVADLAVGKNLQDHLFLFQMFETNDTHPLNLDSHWYNHLKRIGLIVQYLTTKTGSLTSVALDAMAFVKSGMRPDLDDAPDLQYHFVAGRGTTDGVGRDTFGWETDFQLGKGQPFFCVSILSTLLHPRSIGYVRVKSADPLEYPEINPNYLQDSYDVNLMVHGMKLARKITSQSPMKEKIIGEVIDKTIPFPPESDEYLREYVRRMAITVYHPVGTAKMGPVNDPTTVVDVRGRVKGIKHLRVFDASILPDLPSGNTNFPAILTGEKGAQLIKEDWARVGSKF